MSIDFSVLIWTILCFLLLVLSLRKFLFQPYRSFMKQRQQEIEEGIESGRRAQAELEEFHDRMLETEAKTANEITRKKQEIIAMEHAARERAIADAEKLVILEREKLRDRIEQRGNILTEEMCRDNEKVLSQIVKHLLSDDFGTERDAE